MDELADFKKKYRAHIQEGHRKYAKHSFISMDSLRPNSEPFDEMIEYDRSVQIDMPKIAFDTLIGMEAYFEEKLKWRDFHDYSGYARSIVQDHERELRIRCENPAAKVAYEKYLTVLSMVDSYY